MAVISGRSLHDLAALSRLPEEIHLVGSHGTEFDVGFARALAPEALALRDRVTEDLHAIAAQRPGVLVEHKPAGAALHYRQASEEDSAAALAAVREGPALLPGVHAREGKQVIELAVVEADKGYALDAIRHQVGATAATVRGRRRDRRGCVQPADRARSRHQGRARARRSRRSASRAPTTSRACSRASSRAAANGSPAPTPCRSSATRCSPTARRSRS